MSRRSVLVSSLVLAVLALLPGCAEEAEPARARPPHPSATPATVKPEPLVPPVGTGPVDPDAPELLDPELEDLTATLRAASTAAETFESGSTICEAAHGSLVAMMQEVARRYPDQVRREPPRGAFVQACERLPEEAQECLLPRHAMAHVEECRAVTEALDPEERALLEQVLAGG